MLKGSGMSLLREVVSVPVSNVCYDKFVPMFDVVFCLAFIVTCYFFTRAFYDNYYYK